MLIEQEIAARHERAQGAIAKILARPNGSPCGDYYVNPPAARTTGSRSAGPVCLRTTARARALRSTP
jgi:hypothetical protein